MKKGVKILLWVVGVILALIVIVTLMAAPVAKSYINNHGEELVGRKVHVDQLRLNVYTGHVAIRGLNLYEDNSTDVFAGFDTLDVKAHLLKLIGKTVYLKHITLAGLHVNVEQQGERFNFSSMLDHFASDDTVEVEKDTTPSPWVLKFYNIRLSHAQLHYYDSQRKKQWHIPDMNLRVPGFVIGGEESTEAGLNLAFADGGRLNVNANYDATTNNYNATVDLDKFALDNLKEYVTDVMAIKQIGGDLTAHVTAAGNVSEIMKSHIAANVSVAGVDVRDVENTQVAGLARLDVKVKDVNIDANSFDIESVHLNGLTALFERWQDYNTFSRLMVQKAPVDTIAETVPSDTATASPDTVKSSPMQLRLGTLAVENCNLTYRDHTLPDPFEFPITNLRIEATDLSLSGNNNAKLFAGLPGGGHLMLRWAGNIDDWKQHQDLFITVKGLDMKQLSPWLVAYTGQPFEDGVFGLTSRNIINNSAIEGKNTIDIYKAAVGSRRKDVDAQLHLPLKAALYVLKDKDDKILLDVPIKGNIDNPEFSYMKLVWKTLGNLIVKVATSPARAIGNALGMGADNLDFIVLDSTQHGLGSEQYHQLSDLARIATYDTLVVLNLEQQMPTLDSADRIRGLLNNQVRQYLMEQGVKEHQIVITTSDTLSASGRYGYAVSSEMNIE